jgi:uncharacterized RDD family membrane protein YckC
VADTAERVLRIRTPEGIVFALPLAALPARALAFGVDLAAVAALATLARAAIAPIAFLSIDAARALLLALYFTVSIGYGIACEWFLRGQTIGKRLLKLRVVDATGLKLTLPQVVMRNLLRPIDALPVAYLVGGVASFLSQKGQRLGDLAAGTVVVVAARRKEPDLTHVLRGAHNSIEGAPHVVARLRQRVSPELAAVALSALVRRDALLPAARFELFARIAGAFSALVPFPEELVEGLSDEQVVRDVVDVLFRAARA